jgi:TonB family protein
MTTMTTRIALVLALAVSCASPVFAQDALERAKNLYAAAAYEEALAALKAVPDPERIPQVGQYRFFCLIALGQRQQAEQAVHALLAADPLYQPDPAETPPRVLEAFTAARASALPAIAKQMYLDAKAALDRKDRATAVSGFEGLLRTIDSAPDLVARFEDLRVLADGFATLARALPEPPTAADAAAAATPAASPAAESPLPTVMATRPVAVKQDIPPWVPYDGASRRQGFNGMLRIRVGPNGRVQSAEMIRPVHPGYDQQLLRAAESWLYKPATENGVAVAADVMVEIQLRPPAME